MSSFLFTHILAHWTVWETCPFSTSRSRRQSNSAWHASLWVTGDADAFQRDELERHSGAGKTTRTGGEQNHALHLLNKTGTRTTVSGDHFNMAMWHPQYWITTYSVQCYSNPVYVVWNPRWAAYKRVCLSQFPALKWWKWPEIYILIGVCIVMFWQVVEVI